MRYAARANESISVETEYATYDKELRIRLNFPKDLQDRAKEKLRGFEMNPPENCKLYPESWSNSYSIYVSSVKPGYKLSITKNDKIKSKGNRMKRLYYYRKKAKSIFRMSRGLHQKEECLGEVQLK